MEFFNRRFDSEPRVPNATRQQTMRSATKKSEIPLKPVEWVPTIFQPRNFADYVGQEDAKRLAQIMVQAAKAESRPLPNILITGGFGLGKTSLAQLIVSEYSGKLTSVDLVDGLTANKIKPESGTLIIDEIHLLDPGVADKLNVALDSNKLHIIGCTTDPGKLPSAFKSRFRQLTLNSYTEDDLVLIARHICNRKKYNWSGGTLHQIARRSRSNARQITVYLAMIFDLMAVQGDNFIKERTVKDAFDLLGVDEYGYLDRDKKYVSAMPNRPIGLSALSAILGIDPTTIEEEIEPYLLQTGVIDRTPKGRIKLRDLNG